MNGQKESQFTIPFLRNQPTSTADLLLVAEVVDGRAAVLLLPLL